MTRYRSRDAASALTLALAMTYWLPRAAAAPAPQLNVAGFAACLGAVDDAFDLAALRGQYGLYPFDLLLPYLAVYPGKRPPPPASGLADVALARWGTAFEASGAALAQALAGAEAPVTPAWLLRAALTACGGDDDVFCAVLTAHNVLRTFGRHAEAIYHDGLGGTLDLNPAWFKRDQSLWEARIPTLQAALLPLRTDGGGDRWGEWYHVFGIFSYAAQVLADGGPEAELVFVNVMDQLLNPILAGGPEDPVKAQVDQDAVRVAWRYLRHGRPEAAAPAEGACTGAAAYVVAD